MAASPTDRVFVYPDPSLLFRYLPPQGSRSSRSSAILEPNTSNSPFVPSPRPPFTLDPALHALPGLATIPTRPFALDPTLLTLGGPATTPAPPAFVVASASALAPSTGQITAPRICATGLQPFPHLYPGLQPPVELTNRAQIDWWKHNLLLALNDGHIRDDRLDINHQSQANIRTVARMELEKLWEEAGGLPYIPRCSRRED